MDNCTECTVPGTCDKCDDINYQYNTDDKVCDVKESYEQNNNFIQYQINPLISEVDGCSEGCQSSGTFVCTQCIQGYILISGVCYQCSVTDCNDCSTDKDQCTQCKPGFVLSSSVECQACNSVNCYSCTDTTATGCTECNIGYIGNGVGGCSQCIYGCANCNDISTCSVCYDGFYLDALNICVECGAGIKICNDASTIIQCEDNYALIGGVCVNVQGIYGIKDGNSCKAFVSAIECQECFEGYVLFDDICQKTDCDQGQYQDQNQVCQSCGNNTKSCDFNAATTTIQVTDCLESYYLDNNLCLPCINNPSFGDGKQRVIKCLSSQVQACEEQFQISYDQYNCLPCPENCKNCSVDSNNSITQCNICNDGYRKTSSLVCTQCSQYNFCKTCSDNLVDCLTCPDGYYLTKFGNCSNSIPNCYQIQQSGCVACRNGYKLSRDTHSCEECKTSQTCSNTCIINTVVLQTNDESAYITNLQNISITTLLIIIIFLIN